MKEGQEGKDPFELSGEEFEKAKQSLLETPTAEEPEGDTETESSGDSGDTGQQEEEGKEEKRFILEEPEKAAMKFEIVHRGQVHKVTKEKLVELAQKGFDYDFKVGPHGKLVQLIDSDRGAADVLNDYIRGKYGTKEPAKPELKPLAEFEDEREWFRANAEAIEAARPKPVVQPQRPDPVNVMRTAIQSYDPAGAAEVIPHLAESAMQLSMRDSQRIEAAAAQGDLSLFFKFYDHVKAKVTAKREPPPKQSFKMKSGGGEPPRTTDKQINAWELPQKDFQAMLAKVKAGYS